MIRTIPFPLGDYNYILYQGTDENNEAVDYIDRVEMDENTSQPIRYFPDVTVIQRDTGKGNGAIAFIKTTYIMCLMGNNGVPIHATGEPLHMITNKEDIKNFVNLFGLPIMMSGVNGWVRAIMGFNNLPLFVTSAVRDEQGNIIKPVGSVLTYTPEEIALPPTNDYNEEISKSIN